MNEDLLNDYEQLRLQNMRRNAAGLPDAVFAINRSNNQRGGAVGSGRKWWSGKTETEY